jgi:membrane protein implicated in regulation of membrane protease activity
VIWLYLIVTAAGLLVLYVLAPQLWPLYVLALLMSVIGLLRTRRLLKADNDIKKENKEDRI